MSDDLSRAHITELAQSFEREKFCSPPLSSICSLHWRMVHSIGMLFGRRLGSTNVVPATSSMLSSPSACWSAIGTDDMQTLRRPTRISIATSRAISEP